jgi:hypothetical protein
MNADAEADLLVEKYPNYRKGPGCSVGVSPHRPLIEALLSRGLYGTRVSEILQKERGEKFSPSTLRRHFKGECQCQK